MEQLNISDGMWIFFIAVVVWFVAYGIGYRSGKDRALRDNLKVKK